MSRAPAWLIGALVVGTSALVVAAPPKPAPSGEAKKSEGLTPGSENSIDLHNGAFQHEIAIEVPDLRGLEPELALDHNSSAGNGFLGLGWSLSGFSAIERVGANGTGSRTCAASDSYTLDGVPLVPCTTLGGTHCGKTQSYVRIRFDAAAERWDIWEKDGTKSSYSKTFHPGGGGIGASCPGRYGLTSRQDTSGNTVTYAWSTDAPTGAAQQEVYPDAIHYGGVTIKLFPEQRPDPISYANGVELSSQRQRLRSILVTVGGARLRAYKLGYATSPTTARSRLTGVSEYGRDVVIDGAGSVSGGAILRTHTFSYAGGTSGFTHVVNWTGFGDAGGWNDVSNYATIRTPDIDGDGRADVCGRSNTGITCYRYTGEGWASFAGMQNKPEMADASKWNQPEYYSTINFPDLNGDGKADLCARGSAGLHCWLNNGAASPAFATGVPKPTYDNGTAIFADASGWNQEKFYTSIKFADVNGDGKDDVCGRSSAGVFCRVMNSAGTGWGAHFDGPDWTDASGWGNPDNGKTVQYADVNGDGKADVCGRANAGITCNLSSGTAFNGGNLSGPGWKDDDGWNNPQHYATIQLADVNGDGKADVCGRASDGMRCHLGLGTARGDKLGFSATAIKDTTHTNAGGWSNAKYYESLQFADVNGDGKAELCWRSSAGVGCSRAEASGFTRVITNSPAWTDAAGWGEPDNSSTVRFVDMDGDGKADLFGRGNAGLHVFESDADGKERLAAISNNGSGGQVAVTYLPSSSFPRVGNPPIELVVSQIAVSDGRGTTSTYGFSYSGAKFDRANQRSLGFRYVKRTLPKLASEPSAPYEELWFMQEPYACVGEVDYTRHSTGAGRLLTYSEKSYTLAGSGAGPFTCRTDVVSDHLYDASGNTTCTDVDNTHCKRTDMGYAYDAHGELVLEYDHGNFFDPSDDTTTAITYNPNLAAYIVDTPSAVRRYTGLGTGGTLAGEVLTAYDNGSLQTPPSRGLPTTVNTWVSRQGDGGGAAYVMTRQGHDAFGNTTWSEDGLGFRTEFSFDPVHHLYEVEQRNPLGHTVTTTWDPVCGEPMARTDANGQVESFAYDTFCRVIRKDQPLGGFEEYAYSPLGNPGQQWTRVERPGVTDIAGAAYEVQYLDGLGRTYRTQERGPDPLVADDILTDLGFDVRGNVRSRSLPRYEHQPAETITFDYDELDRPVRTTHPDGVVATRSYHLWTTTSIDEAGKQVARTLDGDLQLVALAEKDGGSWNTATYAHDADGNLIRVVDPAGNVTTYGYNSLGQRLEAVDPDLGSQTFSYDAGGRQITATDGRGQLARSEHDALGRLTRRTLDANGAQPEVVTYAYDEARPGFHNLGEATSLTDASGSGTYDFDAAGRRVQETRSIDGQAFTFVHRYDTGGRLLGTRYPDGDAIGDDPTTLGVETPLAYDGAGRLRSLPGVVSEASYSATGALLRLVHENGTVSTRTYDARRDWLDSIRTTRGTFVHQDLVYGRDGEGKIVAVTSPRRSESWTYGYDELGRLRTAVTPDRPGELNAWTYDRLGNLLTSPWVGSYMYPAAGAPRPHAVLAAGGKAFSYDAAGNLLEAGGRHLTWDGASRLVEDEQAGVVTRYAYDGSGDRLKKEHDGVVTLYPGDDYEVGAEGVSKYFRVGDELVGKKVAAKRFWLHANHVDSVHVITDASGEEVKRTQHAPYGQVLESSGDHLEPLGFTGEHEDENELVYLNARYYDPILGLFLSPDSETPEGLIVGLNRYAYGFNDPINYIDPTGHFPWSKIGKLIATTGATIVGTAACGPACGMAAATGVGMAWDYGEARHHKKPYNWKASLASNLTDALVGGVLGKAGGKQALGWGVKKLRPKASGKPRWSARSKAAQKNKARARTRFEARRGRWQRRHDWWARNDEKFVERTIPWIEAYPGDVISDRAKAQKERARQQRQDRRRRAAEKRKAQAAPTPRRGGCFVAGTLVAMADGSQKPIDEIRIGELVLAYDETTRRVVPSPVTERFVHENWTRESGTIVVNGRLRATDNHPFFVNGAWKRADELAPGDWMFSLEGVAEIAPESAATLASMPGVETVYNLEVATHHTYFAEGLLVHNMKVR